MLGRVVFITGSARGTGKLLAQMETDSKTLGRAFGANSVENRG